MAGSLQDYARGATQARVAARAAVKRQAEQAAYQRNEERHAAKQGVRNSHGHPDAGSDRAGRS